MAKITIDGKEYDTNDLSEEALAQANSLRFVQSELARLQGSIAVHKTAEATYSKALQQAIEG
tara:strand:- start:1002 stop:1187 length:186 start_codon:yes stop_codon:yes gene_type:complete